MNATDLSPDSHCVSPFENIPRTSTQRFPAYQTQATMLFERKNLVSFQKPISVWPFLPSGLCSTEIAAKFMFNWFVLNSQKGNSAIFLATAPLLPRLFRKAIKTAVTKSGTGTRGLGTRGSTRDSGRGDVGTWGRGDVGTRERGTQGREDARTRGRGTRGLEDVLEDFLNKQHTTFLLNF